MTTTSYPSPTASFRRVHASRSRPDNLFPHLPVMEYLHYKLGGIDDSIGAFFGLQHLFGSTTSLVHRLTQNRVPSRNVFLLGKPYSTNPEVMESMCSRLGYWVHPDSTVQPEHGDNDGTMDERIESTLRRIRQTLLEQPVERGRVLLVDDGGRAIRMLHTPEFADILHHFTCVEQTRCGIRYVRDLDLEIPVINVAESRVKLEHESPMIAESVTDEIRIQLQRMRSNGIPTGKRAVVIGYGAIGRAVIGELLVLGHSVSVYDNEPNRLRAAADDGHPVHHDLHSAMRGADILVGCTGLPVLDVEDCAHLPQGAILISASSADIEFQAWKLRARGVSLGRPQDFGTLRENQNHHPCFSLYRVGENSRHFYLMNGGFPVNFNGTVDPIHPDQIQLTRSLLFLGARQASYLARPGIHELDDDHQTLLLDAFAFASRLAA